MFVVGLTGGIGSGKTMVADLFAERGVPIIDADQAAREESQPNTPGFRAIVSHFGSGILQENGQLNRAKLRDIIFADAHERLWLEEVLHPLIRENMSRKINALKTPYCIAVIPLLLEVEFYSFINRILVVDTPEEQQIQRVMQRDNVTRDHVIAILNSQATRKNRLAHAQDVIVNDGKAEDLIPQVDKLHQVYSSM